MDKDVVRTNAVSIWILINSTQDYYYWTYKELKEKTQMSDRELNMAIGWLARENNIEIGSDSQTGEERFFVSMCFYF